MGIKAASTRRSAASTAVSGQAVAINSGTGFSVTGATVLSNTSISLGVVTPGASSSSSTVSVASGPTIANVQYLDANNNVITGDIAVSTTGGNILINGTNFVTNSSVYVNNTLVSNTFISSTQIRAILPAASSGNVALMIFTPSNVGTFGPSIRYSGSPTWTTSAVSFQNGVVANVSLVASSDSTITYTLQAGSTLPTGISLVSSGYLSGTATGYTTNTTGTIVLIATDQEGQATQQTVNWTVAVSDSKFPTTTLLLSSATTGQTANFVKDNSTNNLPITVLGDTRANKFSPYYGDGYYSTYFNGSSDRLQAPASATGLDLGAGDFTVEFWMYCPTSFNTASTAGLFGKKLSDTTSGWQLYRDSGTPSKINARLGGTNNFFTASTPATGIWEHWALVRTGTTVNWYRNGVLDATGTNSTNISDSTGSFNIGYADTWNVYGNFQFSNIRVVKGLCVYTGNFTVPTGPLRSTQYANPYGGANTAAITNQTTLLTCQSKLHIDTSNTVAITVNGGSPAVSPVIPFAASSTYATYGGGYFDGTGDYLEIAANSVFNLGTNNFTIECWCYPTSSSLMGLIQNWQTGGQFIFRKNSSNRPEFVYYTGSNTTLTGTTTTIQPNSWNHVAVVRNGSTITLYVNGVADATTSAISTASIGGTGKAVRIGVEGDVAGPFAGYIVDARIINGTALYTTNFAPPVTPLTAVANTQLLTLQTNGAHNNSTFSDNSNFNNLITRSGNATNGTFSPYSAMGWANYFNGSTDYLTAPSTAAAFATNPWTIECWVYITSLATALVTFDTRASTSPNNGVQCSIGTNGAITWFEGSATTVATTSAAAVTVNTWYHIAFVRSGTGASQCVIYVNGVSAATGTSALNHAGNTVYIARNAAAAQNYFPGYISNFRIVNGSAVYPSAFTPSITPLTAVANTSLLTCQSNRFKDSSSNNYAITIAAGAPSVQAFGPFNASYPYSAASNGGSLYFDGNGDYLSLGNSATVNPGTSDFTLEFWIYVFSTPTNQSIWEGYTSGLSVSFNGSNFLQVSQSNVASLVADSVAFSLNTWVHVAVTRSGTSLKLFKNGVIVGSATNSTNFTSTTNTYITYNGASNPPVYISCYMSDIRFVKGAALYTTTFTPPSNPLTPVNNTMLLINGTAGGVLDAHGTVNLETVADAKVTTYKYPYSIPGQSYYFDGTGDYLRVKYNPMYEMVAEDFTIECWVYRNAIGAEHNIALTRPSSASTGWGFRINSGNTVTFFFTGGTALTSTGTIAASTWTHIAFTKSGNTGRLFINGTIDGSTATMGTGTASGADLRIGVDNTDAAGFMNGYISDLRITKGFARYTANFSVPTVPFIGQ